jgi:UDP-2-acetamido-3-amino-2,3-dideoxy-glucuronate N-acetyltransferase
MIVAAQIGIGYWGINILRDLLTNNDCLLKYACDSDAGTIAKAKAHFPQANYISDYSLLINDPEVQAVLIATPAPTHFKLAVQALAAGKHVFIEKPITLDIGEAEQLIELAKKQNKKLMVGHLLLYHPVINALKAELHKGTIGRVLYMYCRRTNLGKVRSNENVLWSVSPHDLSVFLFLLDQRPSSAAAQGGCYLQKDIEDVVFASFNFAGGVMAHLHASWLDPSKERKIVVVGERGMLVVDETVKQNKLILYKKYVVRNDAKNDFKYVDEGGVPVPYEEKEPLKEELRHFFDCIEHNREPLSGGQNGLAVLRILAAAQKSLKSGGQSVKIIY